MRRVPHGGLAGTSAALCLVIGLLAPATVLADPPERFSETTLSVECPLLVTDDGTLTAFAFTSDLGFGDAFIAYWTEEPTSEEVFPALEGFTDSIAADGLTIQAHLFLSGPDDASGEATLTATLTPEGEPIPFSDKGKHFKFSGTTQMASVAGSVVIDAPDVVGPEPITFDLAACEGFITEAAVFQVIPGTFHDVHDEVGIACSLETEGATAFLGGFSLIFEGEFAFGFVDVMFEPEGGDPLFGGTDALLTPSGVEATFELVDPETGEPAGSAELSAAFTPGEVELGRRVAQNYVQKMRVTELLVDGELVIEAGADTFTFDLAACDANLLEFHNIFHSPNGPKADRRVPANDTPDGAIALEVGDRHRQFTGGASIAPEEPCFFDFGDGELFEHFWGRTVWFTVEGTGGEITIDPSRSDFDTSVAAYADTGGGLEHLACVDDDFSDPFQDPQAPLTFDTEAGVTYYIQVGGFDLGSLFEEEPTPEYGQLRLRVR